MIRRTITLAAFLAALLAASACERSKSPVPETPASSPPPAPVSGRPPAITRKPWDDDLGAILATPSLDDGPPVVFLRDTTDSADRVVEVLTHDDHLSNGTIHLGSAIRSCAWRRTASLTLGEGRASVNTWSLALSPGIATPFGIDGVGDMPPRDSAAMIARVNRLVSAIPEDSTSVPFRGLPIVVRDAWRFRLADSMGIAIAVAMRSLNVESNPRAEAITLIAELSPSSSGGEWRTAFSERAAGPEDRIEGMDLLAAFQVRGARPAVAFVREGDFGLQLEIVERTAPGVWTLRWSSAALPCGER